MIANFRRVAVLGVALLSAGGPAAQSLDSEAARTIEALGLRPGLRVADVGTGNGEWAERIAREVGETGQVYATEVDHEKLQQVEARVKENGLKNVTTILGTQNDTGLPPGCCDAILLRMVYHHFADPARMRASLRSALRRGAPLVVIETEPQKNWRHLEGVPDRGGHGIKEEDLVHEMTADGFELVARHDDWAGDGDRYCVIFRRAEGPAAGRAADPTPAIAEDDLRPAQAWSGSL
jgi:protein-L-isoaspartate O-methyltransferase